VERGGLRTGARKEERKSSGLGAWVVAERENMHFRSAPFDGITKRYELEPDSITLRLCDTLSLIQLQLNEQWVSLDGLFKLAPPS
jgi:hypothetical protein